MVANVLVTVVCITYNHEKYLRDALDGFLSQKTDFQYKIVIYDDASTDNTAAIIEEYALKYPRIIVPIYQKENQYQKGTNMFKEFVAPLLEGKYYAYCEGDDYWCDPHKLQEQVDFNGKIMMLESFDHYFNGRYHGLFSDAIELKKVEILYKQKKYREIMKSKRCVKLFYSQYGTLRTLLLVARAIRSAVVPS